MKTRNGKGDITHDNIENHIIPDIEIYSESCYNPCIFSMIIGSTHGIIQ